jgi:hypothetical protein
MVLLLWYLSDGLVFATWRMGFRQTALDFSKRLRLLVSIVIGLVPLK